MAYKHRLSSSRKLALNARASVDPIYRFYGSHVLSALDKGTEIVDSVHAKQERYAAKKAEKVGRMNLQTLQCEEWANEQVQASCLTDVLTLTCKLNWDRKTSRTT